jgi:hypothetical protein
MLNPWNFAFLILFFESLDWDEWMVRLKNLVIRGSKIDRLLLVDSFVSEKKIEFRILTTSLN